jgi:hypothetical protein
MPARPHRYDFCGLSIASQLPLPELRRGRGAADCTISVATGRAPANEGGWFHEWRPRGGAAWLSFGRIPAGYLLRVRAFADFLVNATASRVIAYPAAGLPEPTLQHLLIDQILPLVSARQGRPTLHASAVHLDRRGAIAFVGITGRGKSTLATAMAARGAGVITDDCVALDLRPRGTWVWPGYPGMRLWPGPATTRLIGRTPSARVSHYSAKRRIGAEAARYRTRPSPLYAMLILGPRSGRGPAADISELRGPAKVLALMGSAYVLDIEDRAAMARLFADLSGLAARVPIFQLRVRHGTRYLAAAAAMVAQFARHG